MLSSSGRRRQKRGDLTTSHDPKESGEKRTSKFASRQHARNLAGKIEHRPLRRGARGDTKGKKFRPRKEWRGGKVPEKKAVAKKGLGLGRNLAGTKTIK